MDCVIGGSRQAISFLRCMAKIGHGRPLAFLLARRDCLPCGVCCSVIDRLSRSADRRLQFLEDPALPRCAALHSNCAPWFRSLLPAQEPTPLGKQQITFRSSSITKPPFPRVKSGAL